jgi:hypothetical protein
LDLAVAILVYSRPLLPPASWTALFVKLTVGWGRLLRSKGLAPAPSPPARSCRPSSASDLASFDFFAGNLGGRTLACGPGIDLVLSGPGMRLPVFPCLLFPLVSHGFLIESVSFRRLELPLLLLAAVVPGAWNSLRYVVLLVLLVVLYIHGLIFCMWWTSVSLRIIGGENVRGNW